MEPVLGEDVRVAEGVRFGANVVVHDGTTIGAGCVVEDNVVLGKTPKLARASAAAGRAPGRLVVGERVTFGAGAVVFAGATVGDGAILGDQTYVRERASVGAGSVIGRGSAVDNDVAIGARVSIQTMVYLTAFAVVEDDVFVGPGVVTTNDDTMNRHPSGDPLRGPVLRRACRVGAAAVLVPGVEVGEEAFVAAGAVVTRDVAPRAVVMGVPAREVGSVADADLLERWR